MAKRTWSVYLGGLKCEEPGPILAACRRLRFTTAWYGRCRPNIWIERRGGMSDGFFIVSRDTLASLSKTSTSLTAEFRVSSDGQTEASAVIAGLMLVPPAIGLTTMHEYAGATPTAKGDTAYLVHVADIRGRKWRKSDRKFNVRCPPAVVSGAVQTYFADSRNGGSDWTWETAFDALVTDCTDLGTLNLPWSPGHKPENCTYVGIRSIDALDAYLSKIGCALARNWSTGAFSVVRVGATDSATTTLVNANWNSVLFDEDPQTWDHGRVPSQVTVYFNKVREHYGTELVTRADAGNNDAMLTPISRSVTAASLGFTLSGAVGDEPIWSSIPAVVDVDGTETATSVTDTTAAANVEADRFYRKLLPSTRVHRVYGGIVAFHTGSQVREVAFCSPAEGGIVTEVVDYADSDIGAGIGAGDGWHGTSEPLTGESMPPDINRKSWPQSYHERIQALRIASTTVSTSPAGGYQAYVQRINPATQAFSDGEEVRAFYMPGYVSEGVGVIPMVMHRAGERVFGIKCGSDTVGGTIYDTYYITPPASSIFPVKASSPGSADSKDRYTFTFTEIEPSTLGYDGWITKAGGRSGTAYNLWEDNNTATTTKGSGFDESHLPSGWTLQPVTNNLLTLCLETRRHSAGTVTSDYWIIGPQWPDGTCGTESEWNETDSAAMEQTGAVSSWVGSASSNAFSPGTGTLRSIL